MRFGYSLAGAIVGMCVAAEAEAGDPKWGLMPNRSGSNLLNNPSAEDVSGAGTPFWWTTAGCEVPPPSPLVCPKWRGYNQTQCGTGCRAAQSGSRFFGPPPGVSSTLYQDVNVSSLAGLIDTGKQLFEFKAHVTSLAGASPDRAAIAIEYYNATGALINAMSVADIVATDEWRPILDLRPAPGGTRKIRVKLTAYSQDSTNKAFFDNLSLVAIDDSEALPMKGVYFFVGKPPYQSVVGPARADVAPPAPYDTTPDHTDLGFWWTQDPVNSDYLMWHNKSARERIVSEIAAANANVIVMSFWGDTTAPPSYAGPMLPVWPTDYDNLFDAAARDPGRRLRILPAIEGSVFNGIEWGESCQSWPSRELPFETTYLYNRVIALVDEFYGNPSHPEWRGLWQTMYDQEGQARLAINVVRVASALVPLI